MGLADAATARKHVRVNATADGANEVIAAVAGKKIRVLGYLLNVTAAGVIELRDTDDTVRASLDLAANAVVPYVGGFDAPAFETAAGQGLEILNPTGVDTLGHLTYAEVD